MDGHCSFCNHALDRLHLFGDNGEDTFLTGASRVDDSWIISGNIPDTASTITDFDLGADVVGFGGIDSNFSDLKFTQFDAASLIPTQSQDIASLKNIETLILSESDSIFT